MINELKPCPFCGGGTHYYAPAPIDHHIQCEKCFAETGGFSSKEEAIQAWNTRTERTCHIKWDKELFCFVCDSCDYISMMAPDSRPTYCPNCGAKVVE